MERSDVIRFICDARGHLSKFRHPLVVTMKEKDLIARSSALFGRKLDVTIDHEIVDFIDKIRAQKTHATIDLE